MSISMGSKLPHPFLSLKPRRLFGHLTAGRLKKLQDLVADQLTNEVAAVEEEEYAARTALR